MFAWSRGLTNRQWMVLGIAWLGWVFDIMDTALFNFAKGPMFTELLGGPAAYAARGAKTEGLVQAIFLAGWSLGGLVFGVLADSWGRSRTLVLTVLLYCAFTGMTVFCRTTAEVGGVRFMTGLGVGGEWAAGAALVAESFPDAARATAAGLLQSAAFAGPVLAALANLALPGADWRMLFLVGVAPAALCAFVRSRQFEPELPPDDPCRRDGDLSAQPKTPAPTEAPSAGSDVTESIGSPKARAGGQRRKPLPRSKSTMGLPDVRVGTTALRQAIRLAVLPLTALSQDPVLRRRALIATLIGAVGIAGAGAVTYWQPNLVQAASLGLPKSDIDYRKSVVALASHVGTLAGVLLVPWLCERFGRRPTIAAFYAVTPIALALAVAGGASYVRLLWLLPFVNFSAIGVSAAFVLYFPELFPARVRATGAGLAYNTGRILSIPVPLLTGAAIAAFGGSVATGFLLTGAIYVLGLAALPFAPETRGQPLNES